MNKDKIFVDRNNVLNWIPENPTGDTEGTILSFDVMENLLDQHGPMSIIVDLSKSLRPDSSQRHIIIGRLKEHMHQINKIALFGESPLMKAVAHFIINASGFTNIKFFQNRQQARQWLK